MIISSNSVFVGDMLTLVAKEAKLWCTSLLLTDRYCKLNIWLLRAVPDGDSLRKCYLLGRQGMKSLFTMADTVCIVSQTKFQMLIRSSVSMKGKHILASPDCLSHSKYRANKRDEIDRYRNQKKNWFLLCRLSDFNPHTTYRLNYGQALQRLTLAHSHFMLQWFFIVGAMEIGLDCFSDQLRHSFPGIGGEQMIIRYTCTNIKYR